MYSLISIVLCTYIVTVLGQFHSVQLMNGQVVTNQRYWSNYNLPGQFSWIYTSTVNKPQVRPYRIITYTRPAIAPSSIQPVNREVVVPQPIDHGSDQDGFDVVPEEKPVVAVVVNKEPSSTTIITNTTTPLPEIDTDNSTTTTTTTTTISNEKKSKVDSNAIAIITGKAKGILYFEQIDEKVQITGTIEGLNNGLHALNVQKYGDLSRACLSSGPHFNPHNEVHGSPFESVRHVGDLGNVFAYEDGVAKVDISDKVISLRDGENNIIGRTITVHENADNLGRDGELKSGPAVGCGIIGWRNIEHEQLVDNS